MDPMPSLLRVRRDRPQWNASGLGRALEGIAEQILLAVSAFERALRAEFDMIEAVHADILKEQPDVQIPDYACACKQPHGRIWHDHQLLCTEAPRLACELGRFAQRLPLPTSPELRVPAFELRERRKRAARIIDAEATLAAIVREARNRGWTPFEDGTASLQSVALSLTGTHERLGRALLALSEIEVTRGRKAIRELAEVVYFSGSRLRAIAKFMEATARGLDVPSIVGTLRRLAESLLDLDTQIRAKSLFDFVPRGRRSPDVVCQEVVLALAEAGFDDAEIAQLVVPTSRRDKHLWERRVEEHLYSAGQKDLEAGPVDSWGTSLELAVSQRVTQLERLRLH